jgi:hypothetical protein
MSKLDYQSAPTPRQPKKVLTRLRLPLSNKSDEPRRHSACSDRNNQNGCGKSYSADKDYRIVLVPQHGRPPLKPVRVILAPPAWELGPA